MITSSQVNLVLLSLALLYLSLAIPISILVQCEKKKTVKDIDCQVSNDANYTGDELVESARIGLVSSQSPHNYTFAWVGDHSKCRNPDREPHAWCYTIL